jgi:hypothetical protein
MTQPIPVDQRIVDDFFRLSSSRSTKGAAWLFGMIATYGIKPEELASFDWGPEASLVLPNKKRPIRPLHPQWVFLFELQKKRPCDMQDRISSLSSQLYRLMAHQAIGVNVTDLLLSHRLRKQHYKTVKQQQLASPAFAGVS